MIDSYKNIERLRYRLNSDLNEIKTIIDKNANIWYEEMLVQISAAIISAMAAGVVTNNCFESIKGFFNNLLQKVSSFSILNSIIASIFSIIVFIIIYVLIFWGIEKAVKKIKYMGNMGGVYRQPDKDYQKEFDNIACDSIFVAFEYKKEYEDGKKNLINENVIIFFFSEVVHYLETACSVTRDLCANKSKYIKTKNTAKGVAIYRINNMVDLTTEIYNFVKEQKEELNINQKDKEELECVLANINDCIEEIKQDIKNLGVS